MLTSYNIFHPSGSHFILLFDVLNIYRYQHFQLLLMGLSNISISFRLNSFEVLVYLLLHVVLVGLPC